MVQIVENWTELSGTVVGLAPSTLHGFTAVRVKVEVTAPVEGFANMLAESKGTEVEIMARNSFVASTGLTAGDHLRCRVRRARPGLIFIHDEHCSKGCVE